jgi:hypothetical protein
MTTKADKLAISLADTPVLATTTDPKDYRGKQNIDRDDVTLPRIAIAQKTNPQLEPDKAEYIEGLKLFELFNTLTKENYHQGPLDFVIIRMDKRAMQFDINNNVVDRDVPLTDPRLEWTTGADGQRQKPEATLFYDYIVLLAESRLPAVLSLKGTGIKVAKKVNAFLQLAPGPAWAVKYRLTSSKGSQGSFSYGIYNIVPAGVADATLQGQAERAYEQLSGHRVNVDQPEVPDADADAVPF